ncbi:unnamed protein product, partial [Ectocarpus fasciculatus]
GRRRRRRRVGVEAQREQRGARVCRESRGRPGRCRCGLLVTAAAAVKKRLDEGRARRAVIQAEGAERAEERLGARRLFPASRRSLFRGGSSGGSAGGGDVGGQPAEDVCGRSGEHRHRFAKERGEAPRVRENGGEHLASGEV